MSNINAKDCAELSFYQSLHNFYSGKIDLMDFLGGIEMPNYCDNSIYISGLAKDIKRFDEQFKKPVKGYSGGGTTVLKEEFNEEEYKKYLAYRATPHVDHFTGRVDNERLDINYIESEYEKNNYSFSNIVPDSKETFLNGWYNWNCNNWGTKWDAMEVQTAGFDLVEDAMRDGEEDNEIEDVCYYFNTAWSPCCPIVKAMAEQYPMLKFVHEYEEEGCQFAGKDTYENGVLTEELSSENGSFREFVKEHLGREYYRCKGCGELIAEYELDESDNKCPDCDCSEIYGYDGQTLLVFEEAK